MVLVMGNLPRLHLSSLGIVDEDFVRWVTYVLSDCYEKIGAHLPELVEVRLFGTEGQSRASIRDDKMRLGIYTTLDENFISTHDAWSGIPKISICVETMSKLPSEIRRGILHHEAAHTVLHGSIEYYIVVIPSDLSELATRLNLPTTFIQGILYLASIAVKDYQATKLLIEKGFIEDQVSFTTYFLKPSDEELTSWPIASISPITTMLYLVSLMKSIACALPLAQLKERRAEINEHIMFYLQFLPETQRNTLLRILRVFDVFKRGYHEDLNRLMREIIKTFGE